MKFDPEKYRNYYFDTVRELLATPSPSGYYEKIMQVIKRYAFELGASFEMTRKGCAILSVKGRDGGRTLGLSAHCDTLGAMVRAITSKGELTFTKVGGPQLPTLDGEYCTVITRTGKTYTGTFLSKSPSSHVYPDAASRPRDDANMYVRIDERVKSDKDVRALGIESGDYICIDPKTTVTESGFLKSRFIDDKASVACLITLLKIMKEENLTPAYDVKMLITMYEEVGHGAAYVPEGLYTMLAVDMGCIGTDLNCTEYDVSICAKDGHGPYDYALTTSLIEAAKASGLNYAVDIYPFYGSDVGAMWTAGYDVPGALVGTGVHASHGMERTHFEGIKNTISLISLYLGL
ncbi:MAG: M42 family metallopeptidase [Clostridia bacterium]|nr:M42 family metallopeptidase [Clostridia bacterium]